MRSLSAKLKEIKTFEKLFVFPLETSFDDSGCDPGSAMDELESFCIGPDHNINIRKVKVEEKQQEPFLRRLSPMKRTSPYRQRILPASTLSHSPESDCDSGSFSRSSSPAISSNPNRAKSSLKSPSTVLVIGNKHTEHGVGAETEVNVRQNTNPSILLLCFSEAGKSSSFASEENLSIKSYKTRIFKQNPKIISRHEPFNTHNFITGSDGVWGSLGDLS